MRKYIMHQHVMKTNKNKTEGYEEKTNLIILILSMILTILSCDRPDCRNQNPVFDQYDITSNILDRIDKTELIYKDIARIVD